MSEILEKGLCLFHKEKQSNFLAVDQIIPQRYQCQGREALCRSVWIWGAREVWELPRFVLQETYDTKDTMMLLELNTILGFFFLNQEIERQKVVNF